MADSTHEPPAAPVPGKQYTVQQSWAALLKMVDKYDEDMVKNWKEDIDTLLVFAGLFSAVVTAFAIESYKWLSKDPEDTTVALLTQISQQLRDPNMNVTRSDSETFHPDASSVLINCFWFLSLILALMSGLLALLCKQWLREHTRETHTRTAAEALALRQLRRDSLEKWRVPQLVATTPILLEIALLLFFAGLLDLAWTRNLAVFVACMVAVGLGAGFYIITALLPLITNIYADICQKSDEILPFRFICPYKSPQAWAVYHFSCMILRRLPFVGSYLFNKGYSWWMAVTPPRDWSFSDMRVLTAFDMNPAPLDLKVYELRALDWATRMFQDSPSMVPHFKNIFPSLSLYPSVVMTGILNYWTLAMWEDFRLEDVQEELSDMTKFQETRRQGLGWYTTVSRAPSIPDPILHSKAGIQVLFSHQYWFWLIENISVNAVRDLGDSISRFQNEGLPKVINLRFFVPFSIARKLWAHPKFEIRQESLSLIPIYKKSWRAYPGSEEEGDERLAFIAALIKHLGREDDNGPQSCLLANPLGLEFIRFIHNEIIHHRLYEYPEWEPVGHRRMLIEEWKAATRSIDGLDSIPEVSARPSIKIAHPGFNGNAVPGQENHDTLEMNQLGTRLPNP
ncbi:hypothetical protein Moror_4925 [Moniliophthora roreri MCA 2997]|uniref:DUF6535 domain-containing protein n=2 Tax=Moniliophthora roreri TaxID=221103 RepID=V2WY15_MONRO|nr:hypothetical protein Moror_4925 [Moniliophthora roreri MCA 2997]KAI3603270.1 hypothetical protein WG66_002308 [Moniliophthora roreri]